MKSPMCLLIATLLLASASACAEDPKPAADQPKAGADQPKAAADQPKAMPEQKKAEFDPQKALYALGVIMSRNLAMFELTAAELETVKKGMTDGILQKKLEVEGEQMRDLVDRFAEERRKAQADAEKAAAKDFLEAAAKEKGAVKTESGLIMTQVAEGTGESPKATDTVKVHYHGTLRDGTVFDSSVDRGTPATFPLNRVVPCWTEAVQKMKVGGRSKIVCPSNIAYGDRGAPPKIKPGAPLVFEVELIEIVQTPPAPAKAMPPAKP